MWKWFTAFILLVILIAPAPVLAATSAEVTVTATGYIVDAPGGFTLTYVSDYEVGISWTKPLIWTSPTSFNDPDGVWTNEANAYDGDLDTYAVTTMPNWLELIPSSPVVCDKIRINAARWKSHPTPEYVDGYGRVEVYYDADWHEIFDGTFPSRQWLDVSLGALKTVEKARICLTVGWSNLRVFEFDFLDSANSAENTMVRAATGRLPESRTDGYLVYYGNETSCSDTAVSLDETATPTYYRAWSETAGGAWEEKGASDFIEGIGMILIAFAVVIMVLMVMGFVFKKGTVFLVAGFAAAGLGFILFGEEALSAKWMFGWACVVVSLVCFVEALLTWMAQRPGPEMDEQKDYRRQVLAITRRKPKYPY